jgi:hypothetical protein
MPYTKGVLLFKKSEALMPNVVSIITIAEKYRINLISFIKNIDFAI